MRSGVLLLLLLSGFSMCLANRVKTPKSANARSEVKAHKAHGKHVNKKMKTNRSKSAKRPKL